jgi:hypothetical protein
MLVPEEMRSALVPLLEELGAIHQRIKKLDETIAKIAQGYPAVERLTQVDGVGTLTALAFALSIDDPRRFKKSRDVGPFVGLCPRKHSSGESDPQLSITRAGNPFLRRILVQSAQYALGPFGPDCELRRHGDAGAARRQVRQEARRRGRRAQAGGAPAPPVGQRDALRSLVPAHSTRRVAPGFTVEDHQETQDGQDCLIPQARPATPRGNEHHSSEKTTTARSR